MTQDEDLGMPNGQLPGDVQTVVPGSVIHDDDFKGEVFPLYVQNPLQAFLQCGRFIETRDDQGKLDGFAEFVGIHERLILFTEDLVYESRVPFTNP
jgi:hypothetical protein